MSKEKGCKCCKQIWYVDMLDKKLKLCPNCYEYCKPLFDDLKIKDKQIADLEAKLAESESEFEKQKEKYDKLYGCYKKTSSEDLQDKYSLAEENEQLKKQLAENEKEISEYVKIVDDLHKQLSDKCDFCDKTKDQDKISFALEQLEKVKGLIANHTQELWTCENDDIDFVLYEEIDNQIKQLKEKNNG